jgi:hypothetical protein
MPSPLDGRTRAAHDPPWREFAVSLGVTTRSDPGKNQVTAMILKEIAVEQFTFTCGNCDYTWIVDYDVQHVEDGHGHQHDYFFCNGQPTVDPTAPVSVICPTCQTTHVRAQLTARRATPAAGADTHAAPATRPSARLTAERDEAPPLHAARRRAEEH